jgi:hypothetical protein
MEPAVRQYDFTSPPINLSWQKKVIMFFVVGGLTFMIGWCGERFFHWTQQSLIRSLFSSAAAGALFVFWPFGHGHPPRTSRLILGHDFIESCRRANWFTVKKRIRREQIQAISEDQRGLRIMDRGKFGSIMLGFIFIPATVPEYQEIKSILSGWAPLQAGR